MTLYVGIDESFVRSSKRESKYGIFVAVVTDDPGACYVNDRSTFHKRKPTRIFGKDGNIKQTQHLGEGYLGFACIKVALDRPKGENGILIKNALERLIENTLDLLTAGDQIFDSSEVKIYIDGATNQRVLETYADSVEIEFVPNGDRRIKVVNEADYISRLLARMSEVSYRIKSQRKIEGLNIEESKLYRDHL